MEKRIIYNCDNCKKEIEIKISIYNKKISGKQQSITCSKECQAKMQSKLYSGSNNKKYSKITKKCENCEKDYEVNKHRENSSKFCCRECKDNYNAQKAIVVINCETCGKEIITLKAKVKNGKRFCSNECSAKSRETKLSKFCEICGTEYKTHKRRSDSSVVCSKECFSKWLSLYSKTEDVNQRLRLQGVKTCLNQKNKFTKPELLVLEYLNTHNINYISQYSIGGQLVADFYLLDYNCILEVYGDYWHANPQVYGDSENLKPLNEMQKKNKNRDIRRYKVLKKLNYNFYSLWEKEIYENLNMKMEGFLNYINTKIRNESVS